MDPIDTVSLAEQRDILWAEMLQAMDEGRRADALEINRQIERIDAIAL